MAVPRLLARLPLPLLEICIFQRNFETKIGDRYSRRFSSDEISTRVSNFFFFFFFPDSKRREYHVRNRDRQLSQRAMIIFRWNAPHLVIAAQTRGRKFNKEQEEVGRVCVASEPVSFFSSSTQTKLFYLTSRLPFAFRDFSLTEQCSQPLTLVVLVRGHLTLSPCNHVYTVYTYGSRFFAFPWCYNYCNYSESLIGYQGLPYSTSC